MSLRYVVSTSIFDAIDFISAVILNRRGHRVTIVLDQSQERTSNEAVKPFDPVGAFPLIGKYGESPDGSVRQIVVAPETLFEPRPALGGTGLDVLPNFRYLVELSRRHIALGANPRLAFLRACFEHLGGDPECVVSRTGRELTGAQLTSLLRSLRAEWDVVKSRQALRFRQGGYAQIAGTEYRCFDGGGAGSFVSDDGRVLGFDDLGAATRVELFGPLDAIGLGLAPDVILGHLPFFLSPDDRPQPNGLPAIELVRSLFLKDPSSRDTAPLSTQMTGVLLDEYSMRPLVHLQALGVFAPSWLFEAVRWVADINRRSDQRWAWSQAPVKPLVDEIRKHRLVPPSASPLQMLLEFSHRVDSYGRREFDRTAAPASDQEIRDSPGELAMLIDHQLVQCLRAMGLPRVFRGAAAETYQSIGTKLSASTAVADRKRLLKDIRYLAWEAARVLLSAIMLYGDTSLRAGITTLATCYNVEDIDDFVGRHRDEIDRRIQSIRYIRYI